VRYVGGFRNALAANRSSKLAISMTTKDTQKLIVETALDLFNEFGTWQVSANRIADTCHLSRGHLYYHFKRKEEIIYAIYGLIAAEMKHNDDVKQPTFRHLLEMFERYLALVWRFRFFYREMTALLAMDPALQQRFSQTRRERTQVLLRFFEALIAHDVLRGPRNPKSLSNLVAASWIVCDNWINFVSVDQPAEFHDCVAAGTEVVIDLFRPYLSPRTLSQLNGFPATAAYTS
jgi:AcrR family transcriptional regulator